MVRALLDGSKTQTRRVVKPQPDHNGGVNACLSVDDQAFIDTCPYGVVGDRLWVRETWAEVGTNDPGLTVYRADYPECVPSHYENVPPASEVTWKPSIHMHRHRSRITLEITGIRVERLNEISEADVVAEGIASAPAGEYGMAAYRSLWNTINGPGSWEANPWVWVIAFRRAIT